MRHSKDLSVTISNLTKARDFISNPENWGKGEYLTGDSDSSDYQACAQGALQCIGVALPQCRAAARMFDPDYDVPLEHTYIYQAVRSLDCGYNNVISFNDAPETTHEDVMRLYSRAIYLAKSDQIEQVKRTLPTAKSTANAAYTVVDDTMSFDEAKQDLIKTLSCLGITVEETAQ